MGGMRRRAEKRTMCEEEFSINGCQVGSKFYIILIHNEKPGCDTIAEQTA